MKIILQFDAGDEVGDEDHVTDGGAHAPVQAVPLPDPLPLLSVSLVRGDARGRLWSTRIARWTWGTVKFEKKPLLNCSPLRYCLLSYVLCLRRISKVSCFNLDRHLFLSWIQQALRRMFPSDQSLTDSGLLTAKELAYIKYGLQPYPLTVHSRPPSCPPPKLV